LAATEGQNQLSEKMGVVMKDVIQILNFTNVKSLVRYTQVLPRIHAFNLLAPELFFFKF
jgi:hypothetical protein